MMFVVDGGDFLIANRDYLLHKFVEQVVDGGDFLIANRSPKRNTLKCWVVDGGDFLIANRCGGVQFLHPLIFVL